MNDAFLEVHAVMKVAIIAENIVAHAHSGFFPAMLSTFKPENQFIA